MSFEHFWTSKMSSQDEKTTSPSRIKTPIQEFYAGSNIFITGGTGFYGKLLIERLLRLCSDLNKIYILVRPKRGVSVEERLNNLFNHKGFEGLKYEVPDFHKKIAMIQGDCEKPHLGISEQDRAFLISNANIIFHAAATVRFDEKIRHAIEINVKGTKNIINLCKECQNLKSVVYISTAYSNCNKPEIEEKFYEPPADLEEIIKLLENNSDEELEKMTPGLIGKYPNTYAYSKALAEDEVRKHSENLPLTVFRPSIVIASRKEPIPGWVDNYYGPTGVIAAVGSGVLRTMQLDSDVIADVIPVDMVVNASIASAWDAPDKNDIRILNYVSGVGNPLTWGDYLYWNMSFGLMYPSVKSLWYYVYYPTKYRSLYLIYNLFLHLIPGILMDLSCIALNKKPQMIKMYMKINKFCDVLTYFATQQWKFHDDNVQQLWKKMSKEDQNFFDFNVRNMHWDVYSFDSIKNIRNLLINDSEHTLVAARKRMEKLKYLHYALAHAILLICFYMMYNFIIQMIPL